MKNTTLLLFTILFSLSTFAQDNFAPIGAKWYADFNSESHSGYTVYEVTKDTIVNNINAKLIEVKHFKSNGMILLDSIFEREIVYEEQDAVFYFNAIENDFLPLYYFNVSDADILDFNQPLDPTNSFQLLVDSLTTQDIGEVSLNVVHTSAVGSTPDHWGIGAPGSLPYAERIGCLQVAGFSSLHISDPILGTYFEPRLRCYVDEEINYQADGVEDCEQLFPISINNLEEQLRFSVFPNPTYGEIHIKLIGVTLNSKVAANLYDISGRLLSKHEDILGKTIDIQHLNTGFYILEFTTNGQYLSTEKIIKR